jgi:hypothetical protein
MRSASVRGQRNGWHLVSGTSSPERQLARAAKRLAPPPGGSDSVRGQRNGWHLVSGICEVACTMKHIQLLMRHSV